MMSELSVGWCGLGGAIEPCATFTIYALLLTYMPTLIQLAAKGALVRFDPELGAHEFEERRIYMLTRVPRQIAERIDDAVSDRLIETSPKEQLDQLLVDFCAGVELMVDTQFKCLHPVGQGVWELKTADVRIFGWFDEKDCFVCSAADTTHRVKNFRLYHGYIEETAQLRLELIGPGGTFVEGNQSNDVVSNWY